MQWLLPYVFQPLSEDSRKISRKLKQRETLVESLIENLEANYPGIKERICDESGNIRRFVNIYLNDEDIRFLDGNATAVKDGDEISVIPAIAGGASDGERE